MGVRACMCMYAEAPLITSQKTLFCFITLIWHLKAYINPMVAICMCYFEEPVPLNDTQRQPKLISTCSL